MSPKWKDNQPLTALTGRCLSEKVSLPLLHHRLFRMAELYPRPFHFVKKNFWTPSAASAAPLFYNSHRRLLSPPFEPLCREWYNTFILSCKVIILCMVNIMQNPYRRREVYFLAKGADSPFPENQEKECGICMSIKTRKIGIIGAGNVGSHLALQFAVQGLADEVVFYDTNMDKAIGESLDLLDAVSYQPHHLRPMQAPWTI